MDVHQATEEYEAWLRAYLPAVIEEDLEFKHQQMASAVFPFLRATFYRWAQRWPKLCPHLAAAPTVLGIGDLHVENYGTWRDDEGRLVWGINDFDEVTWLPYPADLVRLATSAALATEENHLSIHLGDAAAAIVDGYQAGLSAGGEPFVLAERHGHLRRLASGDVVDPVRFWDKMQRLPAADLSRYPADAVTTVTAASQGRGDARRRTTGAPTIRSRRAGLGSLGRPRLVALTQRDGGQVAREVKALAPSAWEWAAGVPDSPIRYPQVLAGAVRDADPYTEVHDRWLVRRLAPDCARIELSDLPAERDEKALLHSMGFEVANVHLASLANAPGEREPPARTGDVLDDLADRNSRHADWLVTAAQQLAADTRADWGHWKG
jgi:uncharacterized protein (DUF2252 family)